jgi:hypothetical protein
MIDITADLRSFNEMKQGWPRERTREITAIINSRVNGEITWDDEAGECWARILLQDRAVVMVCACGPLLVLEESVDRLAEAEKFAIPTITVPSFGERILRCDVEVIKTAFRDSKFNTRVMDTEQFSVDELWFVTV